MKALMITNIVKKLILFTLFLNSFATVFSQYDTIHYIPPVYSRTDDPMELGRSYLFLSTNNTTPFYVTVKQSDGSLISSIQISQSMPKKIWLGYQYDCIGIIAENELNTPLVKDGIIATAPQPFFASIRHSSGVQAMSLTAKGNAAKGTRFRSGHLYTIESASENDAQYKSHMISVMATEDNTTVTFSDINHGVIFHNTPVTGNTSNNITITLNKYESYVIATHLDEPSNTGNDTLVNGTLITSDLPIVVNSGSWCGGADIINHYGSRDIGIDQIVPVELTGREHIAISRHSFHASDCERLILVSDSDNNKIYLNGNSQAAKTLSEGGFYIVPASYFTSEGLMHIESTYPIYVYQSMNTSDSVSYARAMSLVPPIRCNGLKEVTVPMVDSYDGAPADIDIIAKVGSAVLVNGISPTVAPVSVPGNTDWEVYKLSSLTGDLTFSGDQHIYISYSSNVGPRGASSYYSGFEAITPPPSITAFASGGGILMYETCGNGQFVVSKPADLLGSDITYYLQISGEAQNGTDYSTILDSITIPAGSIEGIIYIYPQDDGITENPESIVITISDPEGCNDYSPVSAMLIIEPEPQIDFYLNGGQHCVPFEAQFINNSSTLPGASYFWDFGDGQTSTDANPAHTYSTNGFYTVSLTIFTNNACQDTLYMQQQDLINVHPSPLANFVSDKEETDICHSDILFTNQSEGATSFHYFFDDGLAFSVEQDPMYSYQTDGTHRITLTVTNEFGCSDSVTREIFIEPFNVFAPNTFTPDGNEFNNTFYPVVDLDVYEWNLAIYDRWGELVFESYDKEVGWDGTNISGEMSQDDTYSWVLRYVSCEPVNPPKMLNGHINLIR